MKAKMYIDPTGYAYRADGDAQSIQFLDTSMNLGWMCSHLLTDKVRKTARPAQKVLDEEAIERGWQPWEEPEESAAPQSNAVQLAALLVDEQKRHGGEMTAEGFRKAMGTGGHGDPDLGDIDYSYKGVSIRPDGEPKTKYTWAKFVKFCRENSLIEEESIKCNHNPAKNTAALLRLGRMERPGRGAVPQGRVRPQVGQL